MNLNFRNGASELLELSANELMEYQASRGDCPVKVEVKPRYTSAQLTITGAEPSVFYRISACPNGSWSPLAWTKAYGRNP